MNTNTQWHSSLNVWQKSFCCAVASWFSPRLFDAAAFSESIVFWSFQSLLQLLYVSGLQRWHLVFHLCDTSLPCFFQVSVYWSGSHPSFPVFIPKTACYWRLHRPKKNCIGKSANFIVCMFCQSEAGIMSNKTVIEATGSGVNYRIVEVKRWDWHWRSS